MDAFNKVLEFLEEMTKNADEVQEKVLDEILSRNSGVEYLQRHGLNGQIERETFKKNMPVISYEDIMPDVTRVANGDKSQILCSQPISGFLMSSGTSAGKPKLIPTTEEESARRQFQFILVRAVMSKYIPDLDKGKRMYFLFTKPEVKTPGGLIARTVTTSFSKNSAPLKNGANFSSPIETILCPDSYQSMYSQMLCGLCLNKEVISAGAVLASGFIRAIRFLEKHWQLLCNDIRTGTLNPQITDPSVRDAVMRLLKPDQQLAEFIEEQCGKKESSWKGIINKLWPNTGTMSQYISILDYYCNGLPVVCKVYASSEGFFGVNLNPLSNPSEVSYTAIPTLCYFEFLPADRNNGVTNSISSPGPLDDKEQQKLVDLVDVKLGQEYEIVVTTYAGLYRYRVGDVLKVAGFKNKTPQFNFICRKNAVLSIDMEKTDEAELQSAVENATRHLVPFDAMLIDYTSFGDIASNPGHYVLYWELRQNGSTEIPPKVFEDCCLSIEESLNTFYCQGRFCDHSIAPLEIKIVKAGTFDELMDYSISLGASINQYKTPRCVTFAPIVEHLNSRVVSSYFSPTSPKPEPGH
ncbi:OLC1v1015887C1 [Oldenlandia corymbosa var. corymbosa]|uniref:OLC1v1015887C1 n=1 Tax=Oldenlandia corymbosa var. corymbosa TaxID=529605 RepID=A0AAV1E731_OLDCO|nr:OLC1v1015887C1 [Oldenlandia corymbosa var. corymbosa]